MYKDDALYYGHMLDMARKAHAKVQGLTLEDYDDDEDLRLALTHLVQVIGEAAQRISPEGQKAHPEIPYHEITGTRHRIVHDYMNVDEDIIWQIVTQDLPPLIEALEKIVPPEEG